MGIFIIVNSAIGLGIIADRLKNLICIRLNTKSGSIITYLLFACVWLGAVMEMLLRSNM
jgi:hypothetical protein